MPTLKEIYTDHELRLSPSWTAAQDIVRITLFQGSKASSIIDRLIASNDQPDQKEPLPYTFAGLRAGMPNNDVWAITRNGESIEPHLSGIVEQIHAAINQLKA